MKIYARIFLIEMIKKLKITYLDILLEFTFDGVEDLDEEVV